ncbi:MAG: hypothetical protein AUG51_18620 [Acidobacteria bacterium 13_1_20CM_3_53_8]|nr:MAG: hypothetical protein AUG51_18620 [Acidobacteria bacterium 13_1_20CM_3_53_8]
MERQRLKQLEDTLLDIVIVLDSTLDTVTALLERYQSSLLSIEIRENNAYPQTKDEIVRSLLEKQREISLFKTKVDAIRSKVQGTTQLVRLYFR